MLEVIKGLKSDRDLELLETAISKIRETAGQAIALKIAACDGKSDREEGVLVDKAFDI